MSKMFPPVPSPERGIPWNVLARHQGSLCYAAGTTLVLMPKNEEPVLINHHQFKVHSVAFSPSGAWVASGDARGHLKIWCSRGERGVKYEYKPLAGPVRAIAWSADSRRVVCVGGETNKGEAVCVAYDTGTTLGEVAGHSKAITCVAFRPKSPFRIITGSEDTRVLFHEGPPFQFMRSHPSVHSGFVNGVCFSPEGDVAFSCGSDGIVAMYDGISGDLLWNLSTKLPCSLWGLGCLGGRKVAVACGDRQVRLFDGDVLGEAISVGSGSIADMPMGIGCEEGIFSIVSLDGTVRTTTVSRPRDSTNEVVVGCSGSVVCIHALGKGEFVVADSDGKIWTFGESMGAKKVITKNPVKTRVGMYYDQGGVVGLSQDGQLVSLIQGREVGAVSVPADTAKIFRNSSETFFVSGKGRSLGSSRSWTHEFAAPIEVIGVSPMVRVVGLVLEKDRSNNVLLQSEPRDVTIFNLSSRQMSHLSTRITSSNIVNVALFDENLVAVASASHELHVYRSHVLDENTAKCWTYHRARITCMEWVSARYLVTAGLDKNIYVWDTENAADGPATSLKDIHREGVSAMWCGLEAGNKLRVVSGGNEGSVKVSLLQL